jgi:acyl phosphate:glycerol-3-phosphate acyltransferase
VLILGYIVTALAAYFLGSIPTGYLAAKAKGIDIRTIGSGNIGATNVFRALGNTAGSFVLVVDGLKGFVAGDWLCDGMISRFGVPAGQQEFFRIVACTAVVVGHNYTCWLNFKGGKGIATTGGAFFALAPAAAGIALAVWAVVFALSRYVSLASIVAAIALPVVVWVKPDYGLTLRIVTTSLALLAIYKHRANVQRLVAGTESRVGRKKPSPSTSAPT